MRTFHCFPTIAAFGMRLMAPLGQPQRSSLGQAGGMSTLGIVPDCLPGKVAQMITPKRGPIRAQRPPTRGRQIGCNGRAPMLREWTSERMPRITENDWDVHSKFPVSDTAEAATLELLAETIGALSVPAASTLSGRHGIAAGRGTVGFIAVFVRRGSSRSAVKSASAMSPSSRRRRTGTSRTTPFDRSHHALGCR
jgi:hypothetical protein